MSYIRSLVIFLLFGNALLFAANCENHGALTPNYCDDNHDLVADQPVDSRSWINPKTLIISFAPFEDYIHTATIFNPFIEHLESCLQRKVIFYPMQSNEAEIAAMRSGRLHIAGFSTGSTVAAVNQAGAIPFATQGNSEGFVGANLVVIVRSDSPFYTLKDLKNRRVVHSNPTSLTGHMGAITLFPEEGLVPGTDYPIIFSGKHDRSIQGVKSGDYDAATTTTEILERMIQYQEIDRHDFRIIYQSQKFPSAAFSYAYNLAPDLKDQIKACFLTYPFSKEMQRAFTDSQFFVPVDYQKDWAEIRKILDNNKVKP